MATAITMRLFHRFRVSYRVQHDDIGAHINVGRTFNNLGRFKEAEEAYLKVLFSKQLNFILFVT